MRHRFEMQEFDRREAEEEFDALLGGKGTSERAEQ
jgi:hypothetical protein